MDFLRNFPFFSIVFSLFAAVICSLLSGKGARLWTVFVQAVITALSAATLLYVVATDQTVTFMMGHFPAPFGNEIRFGRLEALTATTFGLVLLTSTIGGERFVNRDIFPKKVNLYYLLLNLLGGALMAMVYTNDLFTGYVFLEILTLTSCGILMIREIGRTALAATRYMILNLLGSGLFLLGIILMYNMTGHLLMVNIHASLQSLIAADGSSLPLTVATGLLCVGLAIKSGLFPFHSWMPDTYGLATPTSASVLSGLVSKGYIFLLVKLMYRVIGVESPYLHTAQNILFVFGLCGMLFGSFFALQQNNINRMTAYSSTAQIGYIYMGIGLGGSAGFAAALFHMLTHAITKPLIFLSNAALMETSKESPVFHDLQGAGHRSHSAGFFFTIGALSMIGIPVLAGFTSKLLFATASFGHNPIKTACVLLFLAVSTILNTIYFIRTVIRIYSPGKTEEKALGALGAKWSYILSCLLLTAMNIALGLGSQPILALIEKGLTLFG